MGKYDVTQKEWRDIMGSNPSHFKNCGDNCPVEQVSWNDVQEFLQKLNAKTGKQYRLPTGEEWEYSCYGGNIKNTYCGGDNQDSIAWYGDNSNDTTHPVGLKQANSYGLYDMNGNVWQWMGNKTDNEYGRRVLHGGSWGDKEGINFDIIYLNPDKRDFMCGFRLARTLP
jgi:formylglycine-generating enzyme required for sulfatase activity